MDLEDFDRAYKVIAVAPGDDDEKDGGAAAKASEGFLLSDAENSLLVGWYFSNEFLQHCRDALEPVDLVRSWL